MTKEEQQEVKAKLIELGYWGADEPGNPTTDRHALGELRKRMARQIAPGFSVRAELVHKRSMKSVVRIVGPGIDHAFTAGADAVLAICRAALELPEFLKQHPECARVTADEFPSELDIG
jgi:hypothetical protein